MGDALLHEWLIAILVGFVGGIGDSLLTNKGFVMPGMRTGSDGRNVYDPGFVGNLLLGGGAGFVAWALSAQPAFSDKDIDVGPIAAAFLAGIGGSEVLASHVKQKYLQGANEQTETALGTSVERERLLRDELARKDEEIRRLKDEQTEPALGTSVEGERLLREEIAQKLEEIQRIKEQSLIRERSFEESQGDPG